MTLRGEVKKTMKSFVLRRFFICLCPTCIVEEGGDEGAVLEEGVAGGDVFKVTLLEQGVLKHH